MDTLAIASFVIAILGIAMQIFGAFPEHKEARNTVVTLSIGVFIGAALSMALQTRYQLTGNFNSSYALLFFLAAGALVFFGFATLLDDREKRDAATWPAGIFTGVFLLTGLVIGLGSIERAPSLTKDEIIILVNAAENRGDFETAIGHLEQLRLQGDETVDSAISARIQQLERRQLQRVNPMLTGNDMRR